MIKLKDEIKRVEAVKGNVVPVSKQLYLNLLKEIKLLRFTASTRVISSCSLIMNDLSDF